MLPQLAMSLLKPRRNLLQSITNLNAILLLSVLLAKSIKNHTKQISFHVTTKSMTLLKQSVIVKEVTTYETYMLHLAIHFQVPV